jgi:hypothetical protein
MSFLHLSLLGGLAVITVPVLLHLFGQRQPQLIDFPALKFVRQTRREQSSSWQLRHFLLLLLRILLLALLALALARPRVHSAMIGSVLGVTGVAVAAALASLIAAVAFVSHRPASIKLTSLVIAASLWIAAALWGYRSLADGPSVPSSDQSAPVAAALIIDNGPSMAYRAANEFRLEKAITVATWVLDKLPLDSRVGVLTGAPVGSLSLDPATARSQVKLIEQRGAHVDLVARVRTALDLTLASELERKEIYVITDLASSSWSSAADDLKAMLRQHIDEVLLQIIDVGDVDQANWRLGDAVPEFQTVPEGGDVGIDITVERAAASSQKSATVELLKEDLDPTLPVISDGKLKTPTLRVVDRKDVDLASDRRSTVKLSASGLEAGSHNFVVRLNHPDPLMIDNQRYITVLSQAQRPALVVADDADVAKYLQFSIDPSAANPQSSNTLCEQVRYSQLAQVPLERFAVVCLYDPPQLTAPQATKLKEHVQGGGGLLVLMGHRLTVRDANASLGELLPGKVNDVRQLERTVRDCFFQPVALTHPIFHAFGQIASEVPWNLYPVFGHWTFETVLDSAQILMNYSDGSGPAVLSHPIGRGQVITITTPIPEPQQLDRPLWNELSVGADTWPSFFLLLGCVRTLSGADQARVNYAVSETIILKNDPLRWPSRYELFLPNAQSRGVEAMAGEVSLGHFDQPGVYRLRGQRSGPVTRSVSVNVTAADTALERLTEEQLSERLGEDAYRLARDRDDIESSVGQARYGRELYPLLMVFVAGLFLAEQAMSNRFYKLKLKFGAA